MDRFSELETIDEVNLLLEQRIRDDVVDPYDYICSARRKKEIHSQRGMY